MMTHNLKDLPKGPKSSSKTYLKTYLEPKERKAYRALAAIFHHDPTIFEMRMQCRFVGIEVQSNSIIAAVKRFTAPFRT